MDEQEDLSVCRDCGGKSSYGFCHDCFTCSDCPCIAGCQCDNCRYNDDVDKLVWDSRLPRRRGRAKATKRTRDSGD